MIKEMIPVTIFPILISNKKNMPTEVRQVTRQKTISQKSSNVKFPVFFILVPKAARKTKPTAPSKKSQKGKAPWLLSFFDYYILYRGVRDGVKQELRAASGFDGQYRKNADGAVLSEGAACGCGGLAWLVAGDLNREVEEVE
jgi:hypothetical protein